MQKLTDNKAMIALVTLAIAAFTGGQVDGYTLDMSQLAKLGPLGLALVIYLEARWRPLLVDIRQSLRIVAKQGDDAAISKAASDLDAGVASNQVIAALTKRANTNGG